MITVKSYPAYNERRYSTPWICKMNPDGTYNFKFRVGTYSGDGRKGEAGDLVLFDPEVGAVYGYGQKDYRGNNTEKEFARFDGEKLIPCDKLGRELED